MRDLTTNLIGVYEKALPHDVPWSGKLRAAHDSGYHFVEVSIDESEERQDRLYWGSAKRREFRDWIADAPVGIRSLCLSVHRRYPYGSEDAGTREKAADLFRRALDFSVEMGIRIIQLGGYDVYYEKSTDLSRGRFLEGLRSSTALAAGVGVMLGIETVDWETVDSIESALTFVETCNSPWMQVYPDVGNLTAMGKDVPREIVAGRGHLVGVHLKDTRPGVVRKIPFGEGTVDFRESFEILSREDYAGPFVVEMWNEEESDARAVITAAREWLWARMRSVQGESDE